MKRKNKKPKNSELWEILSAMPPRSHWPNRPAEFSFDNSHVIDHIEGLVGDRRYAVSLFRQAAKAKIIVFDKETRMWQGKHYDRTLAALQPSDLS